ncbi:hypothetical protein CCHR01_02204 [Colletotrichum chrysophilum]|uniref:Uncharacterized protein n=1 Tax=Colletotrichum chrysophilum TaxID=1836956 RepID=A0AAD9AXE1_9PEZI|nr:hypothetical protein CCHR01_02204 [Colletotrichum chrysophilum]
MLLVLVDMPLVLEDGLLWVLDVDETTLVAVVGEAVLVLVEDRPLLVLVEVEEEPLALLLVTVLGSLVELSADEAAREDPIVEDVDGFAVGKATVEVFENNGLDDLELVTTEDGVLGSDEGCVEDIDATGVCIPELVVGEATDGKEFGEEIIVLREDTDGNVSEIVAGGTELVKSMMVKTNCKTGTGDSTPAVA